VIPNLGFGGAQRVFHDLAVCLRERFEVIECVFNFDNGHAFPSENRIVSLEVPAGKSIPGKIYFFIQRIIRLRKLKKELGVQYCISHLEGADYVNILSKNGEQVILCIHGSKMLDRNISGWLGWVRRNILMKFFYRSADKIVVVADGIKDELTQSLGIPESRLTVINNGFNLDDITAKSKAAVDHKWDPLFDSKGILITHGRLAEEKDQRALIDIMLHPRIRKKFRLVIIGDGPLRQTLIDRARQHRLNTYSSWEEGSVTDESEVVFAGYSSNPFAMLGKASLYLFPSLYEGFPMALGEAMTCGLPVISRNCPYGPGEILNPGKVPIGKDGYIFTEYGVLISHDIDEELRIKAWVEAIEKFMDDPSLFAKYKAKSLERSLTMSRQAFCDKWISTLS
jgi:glycosyltransferase involved in cell wall biosynthesis